MSHYRTCLNCLHASDPCDRRDEVRAAIKGAGITLVKFRCVKREPLFRKGQRVLVSWPVYDGYEDVDLHSWSATVINEVGSRYLISIDDADSDLEMPAKEYVKNERLFAKVSAQKLKPLDEPDRAICGFCENAPAPGESTKPCRDPSTWSNADGCPLGCLRARYQAEAA